MVLFLLWLSVFYRVKTFSALYSQLSFLCHYFVFYFSGTLVIVTNIMSRSWQTVSPQIWNGLLITWTCVVSECVINANTCVPNEDSDQPGLMPRLIWVFIGRILLVLSWGCSNNIFASAYCILRLWIQLVCLSDNEERETTFVTFCSLSCVSSPIWKGV